MRLLSIQYIIMEIIIIILALLLGISTAVPIESIPIQLRQTLSFPGKTWQNIHVSDNSRYNPALSNLYHLFTRENPTVSEPLLMNNNALLANSNYQHNRRIIVLIHDYNDSPHQSNFISVVVPAILEVEDVNIIVVDWSAGTSALYPIAALNAVTSGHSVAAFINWLNLETGSFPVQYHIIGHGLGAHQAGIAARRVYGIITFVTGLDPSLLGWLNNTERFQPNDALYTEVIHTNAGINGYLGELAQVDFYPNGGQIMPSCPSASCDHAMSYVYFAESILTRGFTSRQCATTTGALLGICNLLPGRLQMGSLRPKIGFRGIYYVPTNDNPPFSQD